MRTILRSGAGLGALVLLASCAQGPQFVGWNEARKEKPVADAAIAEARATTPDTSDPYLDALHREYMQKAEFEYNNMSDWRSTVFYKDRVVAASNGQPLPPTEVSQRIIPAENVNEISEARARLVAAQTDGPAIQDVPEPSAQALAAYDCWLEQQEENIQPPDIASCKEQFEATVALMEEANAAAATALEDIVISADVLFDFDQDTIKPEAEPVLVDVAAILLDHPDAKVTVVGHTDNVGTEEYNLDLSERRAAAVDTFLEGKGVPVDQMIPSGAGMSQPVASNDTAEGRAQNRRVEITRIE